MAAKSRVTENLMEKKVFDIKEEPMPKGAWWWWFWLFFFDNPKDRNKPRQLMILWSTKNEKQIDCNGLKIRIGELKDRSSMEGAVAAWYFDGEKMHHDFLLDKCNLKFGSNSLSTDSAIPTSFSINGWESKVKIGSDFEFVADGRPKHEFAEPDYHSHAYVGSKGYSLLRSNLFSLSGKVKGRKIKGTAYFQRVFVNAPSPSWYWGIFHFANGGVLTYFNPRVLGKSVKKDISFFDGSKMHRFGDIDVMRSGDILPVFDITGRSSGEEISFTVEPYSHSSWTFRKRLLGIIPNKLVYNEYPAVISGLELKDKVTGKKMNTKKLGKSVGNAEHTTGMLL